MSLVDRWNTLPISEFRELLVDPVLDLDLQESRVPVAKASHGNDVYIAENLSLGFESAKSMPSTEMNACLSLVESTSAQDYETSGSGWKPKDKIVEMRLPDLRYLLIRSTIKETGGDDNVNQHYPRVKSVLGFVSFMLTYEDGYEVIYCYEIHLSAGIRSRGTGKRLMQMVEAIGRRAGVQKAMLTVFKSNQSARKFYTKLGYSVDEYSPTCRNLRSQVLEPRYEILSKILVDKVTRVGARKQAQKAI